MTYLDDLLGKQIQTEGVNVPQRKNLNFVSGTGVAVTVSDNPTTGATDVEITTGAGGGHEIQLDGVAATQRSKLNFLTQPGIDINLVDNSGDDSTEVEISLAGGSSSTAGATPLTNNTPSNVVTMSGLEEGAQYELDGWLAFTGSPTGTRLRASWSDITETIQTNPGRYAASPTMPTAASPHTMVLHRYRMTAPAGGVLYLVVDALFSGGAVSVEASVNYRRC
jgi:hypothetical protein